MAMLSLSNICKTFPGVKALDDVELTVHPGEIHALCGENGAGKSTLMNILAGNLQPDQGQIKINDSIAAIHTPQQAFDIGIAIVYQHLSLADNLNVAENIFANQHPKNRFGIIQFSELYKKTEALLQELQLKDINPKTLVLKLSPAQKQMVEIAKALSKNPSILILDEPTASLTEKETSTLFNILTKLKNQGVCIIYISHRLEEIFLLADRITILKDGKYQGCFLKKDLSKDELIKRMVGREIKALKNQTHYKEEVLLSVLKLSGNKFSNISFCLHRGEILGIAGLVGAGRTEIVRAIFGADPIISGEIKLRNELLESTHPYQSISRGLAFVPEERKQLGLFPEMTIQDNIIIGTLCKSTFRKFYHAGPSQKIAIELKNKLNIITPDVQQKVNKLSGGNQQKVVLAKWLLSNPDVLIVDEPTNGIDIGAKFEIYEMLRELTSQGKGIIIVSSDLPELLGITDNILVIKKGSIAGKLLNTEATEEKILALASN
ncbi:MAG: sugar ABC transporter ATP-binding protein [Chitinophagaceae bacterium]